MRENIEKTVVGYTRCSTDEKHHSGFGLIAQEAAIANYAQNKGWAVFTTFMDFPESGKTPIGDREAGKRLLDFARRRPTVVIAARLDRLFRNSADGCKTIADWYESGIELVSIAEGIDLTTPYGRFFARLNVLFAELERELISDRTRAALAVKRERGERISRDAPYGWEFTPPWDGVDNTKPENKMRVCREEWKVIATMRKQRSNGKSYREIAQALDDAGHKPRRGGAWSHSSVRRILENLRNVATPPDVAGSDS